MLNSLQMVELYEHGVQLYPEECCGLIFEKGHIHKATNILNALHKSNPTIYERDASKGYSFSIEDVKKLNQSFNTDNPVSVIYHSHPDVGAYFSEEDKAKALFETELIFPVDYLVLDIRDGTPHGAKLFAFRDDEFLCIDAYDESGKRLL